MGEKAARRGAWKELGNKISKKLWFLESDALIARARRRTGLEEFGDPPVEQPLRILSESLEREASLHPLGRFLMRIHLQSLLETRLRLNERWRETPALSQERIRGPIFVTGMPRSGSTFLHELLAEDPANRAPRVWEVMFPVPLGSSRRDSRPRMAANRLWWFRRLAKRPDSVYPMRANTPHECVAIHSYTLLSQEFVSTARIPGYESFLRSSDLGPVYAWQKRFLQYLQSCSGNADIPRGEAALSATFPKRWILKAPDHVYCLKELFSIFPDAVIVQTHRNPLEVLRSSIQLTEVLYNLFAWTGDRDELAEREAMLLARAMEKFIEFRDAHPELAGRFIDIRYADLVADPLAAVRRVYERFNLGLSNEAAERMRQLISQRSRYRKSNPTLTEFGVDVLREARRFSQYCFRFGVPCQ
jgi:Sulfotransferase family